MIRKYHNHTPQTIPRHCEEEPQIPDCDKTSERQLKQSIKLSLSRHFFPRLFQGTIGMILLNS